MEDYDFNSIDQGPSEFDTQVQTTQESKSRSPVALALIIIAIVVGVVVILSVVAAGVVFMWASSFTDEASGGVETVNVKGSISATDNELTIEIITSTIDWMDYKVMVDGQTEVTTTTGSASAGQTVTFTGGDFQAGNEYNVRIINIGKNMIVWEDDITAGS